MRNAGGVIAEARRSAFVVSQESQRVYPVDNDQTQYALRLLISEPLSQEEIAFDSIVLVNAAAVDASGNQTSFSRIAFTGEDIQEEANALIVSQEPIVINSPLQTPVISPSVEFQFRGLVNLSGPGNGITYESLRPDLVGVTDGGVIFALAETEGVDVTISVTYPGLDPVLIPVLVDFSKVLTDLRLVGLADGESFELHSLNTFVDIPALLGVFDDGSTTLVSGQFTPSITVNETFSSLLELDNRRRLAARSVIPATSPAEIIVRLLELPGIESTVFIRAIDAVPNVELTIPGSVAIESELLLEPILSDDVGISQVTYTLDGAIIGQQLTPPFSLALPVTEQLEGRVLNFSVSATDTAGQISTTPDTAVRVVRARAPTVPPVEIEAPRDGARHIEGTPLDMQVSTNLGEVGGPDTPSRSEIRYVEYLFDGAKIGEATFPLIEIRVIEGIEFFFEVWRVTETLPQISIFESSLGVTAVVNTASGGKEQLPVIVRLVENTAPVTRVIAPVVGAIATAGQPIEIVVEIVEDTLEFDTLVEFYVNDELVERRNTNDQPNVNNELQQLLDDLNLPEALDQRRQESSVQRFTYTVSPEALGDSLRIRAVTIDYLQAVGPSPTIEIPVRGDQNPTVGLENPVEGASFVSGLPIQLRANAVDDIEVSKVDFL
ncbi:MAG: hypothetical protein GXP21_00655 [Gammaproteobacteria bacterium]|nr:hypothetical protein [Gammaproteobacteria bacterium]